VDEPRHGLDASDARADEDRGDDGETGTSLGERGAQREGDAERDGGQRVAEVVDQVGEQSDAAAGYENDRLSDAGQTEYCEGA